MAPLSTTIDTVLGGALAPDRLSRLLGHLRDYPDIQDGGPLPIAVILESNGVADALWCMKGLPGLEAPLRQLACDFAERVLPDFERAYPGLAVLRQSINIARGYARGEVSPSLLAEAASAAYSTAFTIRWTVRSEAACCAAAAAAGHFCRDAATGCWYAAEKAAQVATDREAEREWQAERLRRFLAEREAVA